MNFIKQVANVDRFVPATGVMDRAFVFSTHTIITGSFLPLKAAVAENRVARKAADHPVVQSPLLTWWLAAVCAQPSINPLPQHDDDAVAVAADDEAKKK